MAHTPPVIDFAPFYTGDTTGREKLKDEIRSACEDFGFFQLRNHGISTDLQADILKQSEELFKLPVEIKEKYNKDTDGSERGYERLRAQNFEKRAQGDLKEGYYLGPDLPLDDPYVQAGKFGQCPNKYPKEIADPERFRKTVDLYQERLSELSANVLSVMLDMLGVDQGILGSFCDHPISILRLLHYPPQPPNAPDLERGIGAHTDFGVITILLQDDAGGLQVWNRTLKEWVDVTPMPDTLVVNTGNLMMRWTNDRFISNLHRVINKSGKERYSVPFFFNGNPDFVIECLKTCKGPNEEPKYGPITTGDWMESRYADTYGTANKKKTEDLVRL